MGAMLEFIKKGMLAGLGAAVVTRESAAKVLNELVEKGKISRQEASETADRLVEQGKGEFEKTRQDLNQLFHQMLNNANVATNDDLKALKERVAVLEAHIENCKKQEGECCGKQEADA